MLSGPTCETNQRPPWPGTQIHQQALGPLIPILDARTQHESCQLPASRHLQGSDALSRHGHVSQVLIQTSEYVAVCPPTPVEDHQSQSSSEAETQQTKLSPQLCFVLFASEKGKGEA